MENMGSSIHAFVSGTLLGGQEVPEALVRALLSGATRVTGCSCAQAWLYDGQRLSPVLTDPASTPPRLLSDTIEALVPECFRLGTTVTADDLPKPSVTALARRHSDRRLASGAAIPLLLGEKPLGVLGLADGRPDAFSPGELRVLQMVASLFGLAIHHCTYFPQYLAYWSAFLGMKSYNRATPPTNTPPWVYHPNHFPKGINEPTLRLICDRLLRINGAKSVAEISASIGLSGVTVRRYLEYLVGVGMISRGSRYPDTGRPSHVFWLTPDQFEKMASYVGREHSPGKRTGSA